MCKLVKIENLYDAAKSIYIIIQKGARSPRNKQNIHLNLKIKK